ncbi:hypothetical protein [Halobacterium yunchengense]|uniref:hypothetical protein n=1 Tax=Halobacterium yunchengense TaxID=3108497 RepID=UPI00300A77B3
MTHKHSEWEPEGRAMQYKGEEVWDHNVAPGEVNVGEQDPAFYESDDEKAADADDAE